MDTEVLQSFAYERKKDSAVIWRCFSHDTRAVIPASLMEVPVTEIAPYAFSAHMDEEELKRGLQSGAIRLYVPRALGGERCTDTSVSLNACGELRQEPAVSREVCADLPDLPQLCGERLEEIVLPRSVRRIGRYCFYNCSQLQKVAFGSQLTDWGRGVFTGCHHVRLLRIHMNEDQKSSLKEVLDELPEALAVEFVRDAVFGDTGKYSDQEETLARLVFPEFYEEGVENTPARILETHVHGTGMMYRNCFREKRFDYGQYDRLFPHAVVQEPSASVGEMAVGRLKYPYGLTEQAQERYEAYLLENSYRIADLFLKSGDPEEMRWFLDLMGRLEMQEQLQALLSYLIEKASAGRNAELLSYLMNRRRTAGTVRRKRLEL